jgi:hypothetical protein
MAAWRRRALASFPSLRRAIVRPGYSIYLLFFDLGPLLQVAHRNDDESALAAIYDYAEWCLWQTGGELSNAAGVAFYEHLFFGYLAQCDWELALKYLSPRMVYEVAGLWEWRLRDREWRAVRERLVSRGLLSPSPRIAR